MSQEMDSVSRGALMLVGIFVGCALLSIAGVGGIAYVAWHFISKFW